MTLSDPALIKTLAKKAARLIRAKTAGAIAPSVMFDELDKLLPEGSERLVLQKLSDTAIAELVEVYRERSISLDTYDYRSHRAACDLGFDLQARQPPAASS